MSQLSHILMCFNILRSVWSISVFFCGIMALSLIALFSGTQDEALAQIGNSSGYEFVTKWGTQGEGPGQFDGQNDVVPLAEGFVIVPDYDNHRLQKFSDNGTFIAIIGTSGELEGEFDNPHSVDVDSEGNIYVSDKDNHRIQKFSSEGDFITTFGSEGTGDGQFTHLHGIAVDPIRDFVYATDT
jgi:DNA-binding beta-propeller fold protein YncE